MPPTLLRRYWFAGLGFLLILALLVIARPAPAPAESRPETSQAATPSAAPTEEILAAVAQAAPRRADPTATPEPTQAPPPTAVPPTEAPAAPAEAPPAEAPAAPRVGIQVGHWKTAELPEELKRLRGSTGAFVNGISEVNVNLEIAQRVVDLLKQDGVAVDMLPATVPPGYQADAFVAIHADGSSSSKSRGYKLATPWRTSAASQHLLDAMTDEYGKATGMPRDGAITFNMRGYYAFSYRRHAHSVAKTTPSVIIETGFLTNATDRGILLRDPNRVAVGIANGIIRYLNERDPNDTNALMPPEYGIQRAIAPAGVDVRAAPSGNARVLSRVPPTVRLIPIRERDEWYEVVVTNNWRIVGWVRKSEVAASGEPLPSPPASSDS